MCKEPAFLLALLVASAGAGAQTMGIDTRFGTDGVVLLGPTPTSGFVAARLNGIAVQPDGKIVLAARTYLSDGPDAGTALAAVGRLNADGSWDTSFADHGLYLLSAGASAAPSGGEFVEVRVLSDGSIIAAGGSFVSKNSADFNTCTLLAKVDKDGVPIDSFGPQGGGSFCFDFAPDASQDYWFRHFESIAADSDDSFFMTTVRTNLGHGAVAHFDASGALLPNWGSGGIAALPTGIPSGLLQVRADHSLIVAGVRDVSIVPSEWILATTRLDPSGLVDSHYGTNGEFDVSIANAGLVNPYAVVLHGDKMLVASYTDGNPFTLYDLDQDGAVNLSFNDVSQQAGFPGVAQLPVTGDPVNDYLAGALPLPDGHILAYGLVGANPMRLALIRLAPDSAFDASFGDPQHPGWGTVNVGGLTTSDNFPHGASLDAGGHVLLAFHTNDDGTGHGCVGLVRMIPDRLLDNGFDAAQSMPTCPQ